MTATAIHNDGYGSRPAKLVPQKTTRGGKRVVVYRWVDNRGFCCDGLRGGHSVAYMLAAARHDRRFSDVREG